MNKTIESINLSPSFLSKVLSQGYDKAVAEKIGLIPKDDTTSMSDGRLIHGIIAEKLGGEKLKYVISPFENYRTKVSQEWRDRQPDDVAIVKQEQYSLFNEIAERVINHPNIKPLLKDGKPEQVIEKQVNGFNVKGILDWSGNVVIDWKFVSSKNFDNFVKVALWEHYDLQAAVYDYLKKPNNIYFCAVESSAPFRIKLYHCDQSFLDGGADKFGMAVSIIKEAKWRLPTFDIEEVGELMDWNHYSG